MDEKKIGLAPRWCAMNVNARMAYPLPWVQQRFYVRAVIFIELLIAPNSSRERGFHAELRPN